MFTVIVFFLFNGLMLLGDSLFTCFVGVKLLQRENGGLLSGMVFGMEAFFEIAVGPFIARYIDSIEGLNARLRCSLVIQCCLIIFVILLPFIFVLQSSTLVGLIGVVALIRLCMLVDQQLKTALPLFLERQGRLPLLQTLSVMSFMERSAPMLSSSLAPVLLGLSWLTICTCNGVAYIFAVIAVILILKFIKSPITSSLQRPQSLEKKEKQSMVTEQSESLRKQWGNWYSFYLLLSSFALSSVVLVLTKSMLIKGTSPWISAVEGPAPIYCGMIVALVIMIFFPIVGHFLTLNAKRVCLLTLSISATLLCAVLANAYIRPLFFFLSGTMNGISLVGSSFFAQNKLDGKDFVASIAKSAAFKRIGAIASLMVAGLAIDAGASCNQLLIGAGACGVIFCLFLGYRAIVLEQIQQLPSQSVNNHNA